MPCNPNQAKAMPYGCNSQDHRTQPKPGAVQACNTGRAPRNGCHAKRAKHDAPDHVADLRYGHCPFAPFVA